MEFKVLIYIIIGIIWLFSKLLSAKGKQKEEKSIFPESWTKPFERQLETVITDTRERKKIKHQEKSKNLKSSVISESEKINFPQTWDYNFATIPEVTGRDPIKCDRYQK